MLNHPRTIISPDCENIVHFGSALCGMLNHPRTIVSPDCEIFKLLTYSPGPSFPLTEKYFIAFESFWTSTMVVHDSFSKRGSTGTGVWGITTAGNSFIVAFRV
jgi:hypothetical protein